MKSQIEREKETRGIENDSVEAGHYSAIMHVYSYCHDICVHLLLQLPGWMQL
jgi:cytochrome oxidase Cu insertion factor (SCO1/SenC/PrrC family)